MATIFIDNVPFKHRLSGQDLAGALDYVSECKTKARDLRDTLWQAVQDGDGAGQTSATTALLTDPASLVAAAVSANKKLKAGKRQPLERCLAVPSLLNFQAPFREPVPVYPQPKKTGGVRMIHNPGLLHRTAQTIVKSILGPYFVPRDFQYTHAGVPAAIKNAKALAMAGHVYTARLDIKDFFVSFIPERLTSELPLDQEVVEHAVAGRHMKVVMDQEKRQTLPRTHTDLLLQARLGISQGSGCSPIVGMFCMSRLPWVPMTGVALHVVVLGEPEALVAPGFHVLRKLKAMTKRVSRRFALGNRGEVKNG